MSKDSYYQFNAGVNYRDSVVDVNELKESNNLYWEGALKRRLGYETKHADLVSPATNPWPTSGITVLDHMHFKSGSSYRYLLFANLLDTGGTTNVITMYFATTLPITTAAVMNSAGTATATTGTHSGIVVPYVSTVDPLSVCQMDDKIWMTIGDRNPYVIFEGNAGSWMCHEYPLCQLGNWGESSITRADGACIIPGTTAANNGDWDGAKLCVAGGGYVIVSDGKTKYWGISEGNNRADNGATYTAWLDRSSGVQTTGCPSDPGWGVLQFTGIEENLNIKRAENYKKYYFFYGEGGILSFYLRGLYGKDYEKTIETRTGVYGKIVACDKGVFFIGKDGVYGFDGTSATNISKKIWPQIKVENPNTVSDFTACSLAYHNGYIWVSFPGGTNKEIYVFDPDLIYDDEHGESHAPFFRYTYTNTSSRTAQGFDDLQSYDNHLYGLSSGKLYELDAGGKDNETTAATGQTYNGISFQFKTPYYDQENPNIQKVYRQITLEANDGLCDTGTTASMAHVQVAASVNFSTQSNMRAITDTGQIDLEAISSGVGHVYKTIDVPMTTAGYVLDGQTLAIEVIGNASGSTDTSSGAITTGSVAIYGLSLTYDLATRSAEEVTS